MRSREHQKLTERTWMSNVTGSEFISKSAVSDETQESWVPWCLVLGQKDGSCEHWSDPWALGASLPRAQAPRTRYSESFALLELAFSSYSCAFANAFPSL